MASELDRQLQRGLMSDIGETRAMARECIAARERIAELERLVRHDETAMSAQISRLTIERDQALRDLEAARADAVVCWEASGLEAAGVHLQLRARIHAYAAGKPVSVEQLLADAWTKGANAGYEQHITGERPINPYSKEPG